MAARRGSSASIAWIHRVKERLATHLENKTTDRLTTSIQSNFARDYYFNASRDQVVRAAPSLTIPSSLLPLGHVFADRLPHTGTPILVHRDRNSGKVRAYVNQCSHRGALLVSPPDPMLWKTDFTRPLKGNGLTCPYHSWTYDVRTGDLKKVPGEEDGFPCLNKNSLNLQELSCEESAGGIWVGGEEIPAHPTVWSKAELDSELSDLWLAPRPGKENDEKDATDSATLVGFKEWTIDANWQLLVETFLEAYHVQYLHKNTLGLVTQNHHMVVDRLDWTSFRHTVALKSFQRHAESDSFFHETTTTYFAFPNVAISLFKRFAIFLCILPNDPVTSTSSTTSRIRAWGLSYNPSVGEDMAVQQRDFESVVQGIEEDWSCAQGIQKGLRPETMIHHGRFEGMNVEFLKSVDDLSKSLPFA